MTISDVVRGDNLGLSAQTPDVPKTGRGGQHGTGFGFSSRDILSDEVSIFEVVNSLACENRPVSHLFRIHAGVQLTALWALWAGESGSTVSGITQSSI